MTMQVCTADGGGAASSDGLINPALLPAKAADLDTTAITGSADGLRTMGSTVDTQTDEIKSSWTAGLPGCYSAPEQESVFSLMDSPATASETLKTTFNSMAGYLDTYADALLVIKPKLADFETRAQAFRDEVKDGVWVDATEAADADFGDYAASFGNWLVGNDQEKKKVPWYEDGDTVEKNNAFLSEIAGLYADVSTAASTCATSINGLTSLPPDQRTIPPIPPEAFTNPESPMPWGNPREEDRNCPESVGHGAYQFGKNTLEGLGSLISYNPQTGDWGDWGNAGQAWMNTGNVLLSLAVTSVAGVGFTEIMKASGNGDNPVVKWMDERHQVAANVVTGLVGIDLNAGDPFHKWKEDGVATFTESFLNVGTMFIPGAGQVGAGLRAASIGSRIARISSAVADFAVPGGSWLVKGGLHTIPVLKNIFKFADEVPVTAFDNVPTVGAKVPIYNPASLIDVVDDLPAKPTTRPVSQSLFGGEGPRVDAPSASATAPDVPTTRPVSNVTPDVPTTRPTNVTPDVPTKPVIGDTPATQPTGTTHPETGTTHPETGTTHPETGSTHPETGDSSPVDSSPETATHPETSAEHPDTTPDGSHTPESSEHRPDGFPAHDQHGREFTFDADGKAHLDGDPVNSYRDANGALHNDTTGRFMADPNKPEVDLPLEKADKGVPADFQVSDAERAAHDARVVARDEALAGAHEASGRLNRLIASTGIDPAHLTGSTRTVAGRIHDLVADGTLTVRQGRSLTNALINDRVSANLLRSVSERLGDKAAAAVARMRGETTLIGSGGAGAGRFDQATIHGNPPTLAFYEAKGGTSQLGERTVDGVRAQQGTTTYVNDIMRTDPRLADSLRQFMAANPNSPITAALRSGSIRIEYDLVQALPGGRIKVTPFILDPRELRLPEFK